jgi:hypothetical protein
MIPGGYKYRHSGSARHILALKKRIKSEKTTGKKSGRKYHLKRKGEIASNGVLGSKKIS